MVRVSGRSGASWRIDVQRFPRGLRALLTRERNRPGQVQVVAGRCVRQQAVDEFHGLAGPASRGKYRGRFGQIAIGLAAVRLVGLDRGERAARIAPPRLGLRELQPHGKVRRVAGEIALVLLHGLIRVARPGAHPRHAEGNLGIAGCHSLKLSIAVPGSGVVASPRRQCRSRANVVGLIRFQRQGPFDRPQRGLGVSGTRIRL